MGQKSYRRRTLPPFSPCLSAELRTSCPYPGVVIGFLGSLAIRLELNYTPGFPRFPACRWQIMSLLNFHGHTGQFLSVCQSVCLSVFYRPHQNCQLLLVSSVSQENSNWYQSLKGDLVYGEGINKILPLHWKKERLCEIERQRDTQRERQRHRDRQTYIQREREGGRESLQEGRDEVGMGGLLKSPGSLYCLKHGLFLIVCVCVCLCVDMCVPLQPMISICLTMSALGLLCNRYSLNVEGDMFMYLLKSALHIHFLIP